MVRRLNAPAKAGLHRVAWDLHFPPSTPVELQGGGGAADPDFSFNPQGPMAAPGKYTVSMAKVVDGVATPLGQPQTFEAVPLGLRVAAGPGPGRPARVPAQDGRSATGGARRRAGGGRGPRAAEVHPEGDRATRRGPTSSWPRGAAARPAPAGHRGQAGAAIPPSPSTRSPRRRPSSTGSRGSSAATGPRRRRPPAPSRTTTPSRRPSSPRCWRTSARPSRWTSRGWRISSKPLAPPGRRAGYRAGGRSKKQKAPAVSRRRGPFHFGKPPS